MSPKIHVKIQASQNMNLCFKTHSLQIFRIHMILIFNSGLVLRTHSQKKNKKKNKKFDHIELIKVSFGFSPRETKYKMIAPVSHELTVSISPLHR